MEAVTTIQEKLAQLRAWNADVLIEEGADFAGLELTTGVICKARISYDDLISKSADELNLIKIRAINASDEEISVPEYRASITEPDREWITQIAEMFLDEPAFQHAFEISDLVERVRKSVEAEKKAT